MRTLPSRPLLLLPLMVCVVTVHVLALDWAARQAPLSITSMPEPLFGRILEPDEQRPLAATRTSARRLKTSAAQAPPFTVPDTAVEADTGPQEAEHSAEKTPPDAQPDSQGQADGEESAHDMANNPVDTQDSADMGVADAWPASTRLTYRIRGDYRGEFLGSAQVQWLREDDRYQVQLDMRLALLLQVSLLSQGKVSDSGLLPSVYEESFLSRRSRATMEATEVRLNDGTTLPRPDGVQDTVSQFVDLTHRFSSGRDRLVVGAEVAVWLARPRGMDLWIYDVVADETLQTPEMGPIQAFHLKPRPIANPRGSIVAELWFAPSLQYLPVRVLVVLGDGNYVDMVVERIEQSAISVMSAASSDAPARSD